MLDSKRVLSVAIRYIASYFLELIIHCLEKRAGASNLWHITIPEYFILSGMRFLVIPPDGADSCQCFESRLLHSSFRFLVPVPAHLQTPGHDYDFSNLISGLRSLVNVLPGTWQQFLLEKVKMLLVKQSSSFFGASSAWAISSLRRISECTIL